MRAEEFIKSQVVLLAAREAAHHGGTDNMVAMMFVLRNRVHAGWHGGDWLKCMESWTATGGNMGSIASLAREHEMPDLREPEMRDILAAVDDIWTGHTLDHMTDGGLYYCELAQPITSWFQKNILDQPEAHPRVASVGPVDFFR